MKPYPNSARMNAALCLALGLVVRSVVCQDAIRAFESFEGLRRGEVKTVVSPGYPSPAPNNLDFVMTARTQMPNDVVIIVCDDIRLAGSEPCEYGLNIIDGAYNKKLCGHVAKLSGEFAYMYVAKSGGIYVSLTTGRTGDNYMRCNVSAGSRKDVLGEDSPENMWSYLDFTSKQIDSSEFGGPRGAKSTTCQCGWANKDVKRVINGTPTKTNEYPFMAAIVYRGSKFAFCGGSIVTQHHVMTAAHCLVRKQASELAVLIGAHDITSEVDTGIWESIDARELAPHLGYSPANHVNDIGLISLAKKIEYNILVGPVCLPNGPLKLDNQYVTVMGWGETNSPGSENGGRPPLQKTNVRVLSKDTCYAHRRNLIPKGSPNQLCVYGNNRSSCFGDSGGPLVWVDPETNRYTEVGIVSYGDESCATLRPRVVTDVSTYLEWIRDTIRATNPMGVTCTKAL